jgi:hypothetical protein
MVSTRISSQLIVTCAKLMIACLKCANRNGAFTKCRSVAGFIRGGKYPNRFWLNVLTSSTPACACCHWDSKSIDCSLQVVRDSKFFVSQPVVTLGRN